MIVHINLTSYLPKKAAWGLQYQYIKWVKSKVSSVSPKLFELNICANLSFFFDLFQILIDNLLIIGHSNNILYLQSIWAVCMGLKISAVVLI